MRLSVMYKPPKRSPQDVLTLLFCDDRNGLVQNDRNLCEGPPTHSSSSSEIDSNDEVLP